MFSQTLSIWVRAINPGLTPKKAVPTYQALLQEEASPTLFKALIWIAISGLIAGIIEGLLSLILGLITGVPFAGLLFAWIFSVILGPIIGVIFFVISSLILLGIAKTLGGHGSLDTQSYLLAAVQAPTAIILAPFGSILNALPETMQLVGMIIFFPLIIYVGWLSIVALRSAHGYSGGKALLTVLIFGALLFGFICCVLPLFFGSVFSLLGGLGG